MSSTRPSWSDRRLPAFFTRWRKDWNDEDLTPSHYLDFEGGLRFVLAAAWLFCPETVEYRGAIFLKDRFTRSTVDTWFTTLSGDRQRVESVANHVELWTLFTNTPLTDDDHLAEELPQLALALGETWQALLTTRYPGREIKVEVTDEEDGAYGPTVTFWTSARGPGVT
ncbi:hypothetical protein [Streptomyces sp. NRRL B-3229]|uniref:hypothetical protein n=1 Tax=Streptomyces sp. NRRL B-3229 TaxID=1463836 RepID=UPI0004BED84D|nr:hypothetical protein [Streptomyces sp. NRRL B-3229]